MDVTFLRIAATIASFATFIAIAIWAYAKSNGSRFEEAAQLPFQQD